MATRRLAVSALALLAASCVHRAAPADPPPEAVDSGVPFVPTPPEVVDEMLRLARVGPGDVVYDLGCGDGRIVIAAAREHGARGVGIELDPALVAEAERAAARAGVAELVSFRQADLLEADLRDATVVMLYLGLKMNLRLRPKLLAELKPGARLVSHNFDMGEWTPDATTSVRWHAVHLWTVPDRVPEALWTTSSAEAARVEGLPY